ncbi:rhamnogalacturonan acetylesterase [Mucilaginibacter sp. AW1-3]
MNKRHSRKYLYAIALVAMLPLMAFMFQQRPIKVYLIGDSTMCNYPTKQLPLTGWGMPFANYLDSGVVVDNRAKGGRSTRTFISENRWQPIADSLKAGDYVLMQFGHNDEGPADKYPDRYTSVPDYKINLARFITETRAKNAIPILITPVSRLSFDDLGNAKETHATYSKAVFEVGDQYHVPVIDLDTRSRMMYQQLGLERSKLIFMKVDTGENPNYPFGHNDNTHFNELGARKIAQLVLSELQKQHIALADHIVKGTNNANVNPQVK